MVEICNSSTIVKSIRKNNDFVHIQCISLNKVGDKWAIFPSDMVPEEHWGKIIDTNRFEYIISLK